MYLVNISCFLTDFPHWLFAFSFLLFFTGTHPKEVEKMFDTIIDIYGGCDVLVNNAGITKDNLVMRMKPEQWQAVIDVNLSGTFTCIQEFVMHTGASGKMMPYIEDLYTVLLIL